MFTMLSRPPTEVGADDPGPTGPGGGRESGRRTDLVRNRASQRAIQQILADGEPYGVRILQQCLIAAEGIPAEPAHREKLQLSSAADIERVVTASQALIARPRLALAATEALLDLVAQGIVIEVANAPSAR